MVNFSEALDTNVDDIEKPPTQPQGTYGWRVNKIPQLTESKSGEWNFIRFPIVATHAEDDVDTDELEEFGALGQALNDITFMAPTEEGPEGDAARKKAVYQAKQFMVNVLRVEGGTFKELLDNALGGEFLASATWDVQGDDTFIRVKNYAPMD